MVKQDIYDEDNCHNHLIPNRYSRSTYDAKDVLFWYENNILDMYFHFILLTYLLILIGVKCMNDYNK